MNVLYTGKCIFFKWKVYLIFLLSNLSVPLMPPRYLSLCILGEKEEKKKDQTLKQLMWGKIRKQIHVPYLFN